MCFQVFDTSVSSPQIRRAVLLHATLAFVYNTASYPGVVIAARLIGMLILDERNGKKRQHNDRLVAVPANAPRIADGVDSVEDLPERLRREIEEFFLDTTPFTHKDARCRGWKGPKAAGKLVRKSRR